MTVLQRGTVTCRRPGSSDPLFRPYLAEDDPGRKEILIDIATEELSHLEVIGTIVAMLNKGAKTQLSEGALKEADREEYNRYMGTVDNSGGSVPLARTA